MNKIDIYYRAFKEYRKETIHDNVCERDREEIALNNLQDDVLEATKYLCHIDEEWVKTIEEGLEYVEKAVAEERQFIRTNGEVVEIEKVKKISKDSVEHLAKHSEMITHVPENEEDTIVPDKLYMVEKLSDYAVYENRFLYMMLCYLRDFINYRLERIEKLRRTYIGNMAISKKLVSKKRTLVIETKVFDERVDNPYPVKDDSSDKLIQRIKDCQQIVMALLNTNLMVQVAKSPMIKPPITKTNVLKMNNNFKRSLALYDYVATFKGDGYTYKEVKYNFAPYSETVADEIAEVALLNSFISYKTGNEIEEILETEYQAEEKRRKHLESKKLEERIKRLKKRALESNKTLEEYMLLLEQRNKMLEKDSEELAVIQHEVDQLNKKIDELNLEKVELGRQIENLEHVVEEKIREIAELNQKYIEDMARVKKEHDAHVAEIKAGHDKEIDDIKLSHQEAIFALKSELANERQLIIDKYEQQIDGLHQEIADFRQEHQDLIEDYDNKVLVLNEKIKDATNSQKQLVKEYEIKLKEIEKTYKDEFDVAQNESHASISELKDQNTFIQGQLDGLRASQGYLTPSSDYASRERFVELEKEFDAFKKFFKEQWKLTKKEIRKNVLWSKQEEVKENKTDETQVVEEQPTVVVSPQEENTQEEVNQNND